LFNFCFYSKKGLPIIYITNSNSSIWDLLLIQMSLYIYNLKAPLILKDENDKTGFIFKKFIQFFDIKDTKVYLNDYF
jgi:hypothetical protein